MILGSRSIQGWPSGIPTDSEDTLPVPLEGRVRSLGTDEDAGTSIVLVQNARRVRRALRDERSLMPQSMRALVAGKVGEPTDVLRLESRPVPTPKAGQALIRVTATPIHASDLHVLRGPRQARDIPQPGPGQARIRWR